MVVLQNIPWLLIALMNRRHRGALTDHRHRRRRRQLGMPCAYLQQTSFNTIPPQQSQILQRQNMIGPTNPWNPDEAFNPPAAPEPTRQLTAEEWRTEYERPHVAAEKAKQAAAAQRRTATPQQQATTAAQQGVSSLAAELSRMRTQAQTAPTVASATTQSPPAPPPAPQLPTHTISTRASDLDHVRRQQLKAMQVPMLEGKLDLQLVAGFL